MPTENPLPVAGFLSVQASVGPMSPANRVLARPRRHRHWSDPGSVASFQGTPDAADTRGEDAVRPWIRWTTRLAGLLLIGIGGLAMWKVLSPGSEYIVGAVDGWMFEGPALVTFGLLLLWTAGSAGAGQGCPGPARTRGS